MATKTEKAKVPVKKTPVVFQDRILVTRKKPESVSAGGIIIPETVIQDEKKGIVVNVGPLVGRGNSSVHIPDGQFPQVGDLILFGEYAGIDIEYEGGTYLIMRESDVLCKL